MHGCFNVLPEANFDGDAIVAFLDELQRTLRVPIALIWVRLRARRGEPVAGWFAHHRHYVHAYLLPPYAPNSTRSN
jgi:hypothetical protein